DSLFALPIAVTPPAEADAVARATRTRSDLLAIGDQTTAAERQLDAIRAEVLPALSLFADQGSTGKATQHLLSTYNWGIELSVPVFDGFRRDGRMDEQRAALRELDVRRRDLAQQAAADVRAALLDLDAAREQLAAADERFTLAEQELAQARDRFRAGVSGNADAITASLALNAARAQVVDARAALQAARVSLGRAQGTVTELP
ncbi:MAG: TolC family protein, partial [Gemmatimonadetes bacterium]|nr:TolC family protein [Gemmatimonadota bacterium]